MKFKFILAVFFLSVSCSSSRKKEDIQISFDKYIEDTLLLKAIMDPVLPTGEKMTDIDYSTYKGKFISLSVRNNLNEPIFLLSKPEVIFSIDSLLTTSIEIKEVSDDGINFVELKDSNHVIRENFYRFNYEIPSGETREKLIYTEEILKKNFLKIGLVYALKHKNGSIRIYNMDSIILKCSNVSD